jgi:hypothetical protein
MQRAFNKGGQRAIEQVMKTQPAIFLKMLCLLVPREMQVEHSGGIKAMSDEAIERTIAALEDMVARRVAGQLPADNARVIEGVAEPIEPVEQRSDSAPAVKRKARKGMGASMGKAPDQSD